MDFLFQRPPQPLQFWPPNPPPVAANFVRPRTFGEKHYGQWCRNLTLDRHVQCPKASPFHWYICCGADGTDCCFGIQSWVYVIFGSLSMIFFIAALFWLYLGPTNYTSANAKVKDTTTSTTTAALTVEKECQNERQPNQHQHHQQQQQHKCSSPSSPA